METEKPEKIPYVWMIRHKVADIWVEANDGNYFYVTEDWKLANHFDTYDLATEWFEDHGIELGGNWTIEGRPYDGLHS